MEVNLFEREYIISLYKVLYDKYKSVAEFTLVTSEFDDITLLNSAAELIQADTLQAETSWGSRLNIMLPKCIWDEVLDA